MSDTAELERYVRGLVDEIKFYIAQHGRNDVQMISPFQKLLELGYNVNEVYRAIDGVSEDRRRFFN